MNKKIAFLLLIALLSINYNGLLQAQQAIDICSKRNALAKAYELFNSSMQNEYSGNLLLAKKYEKEAHAIMQKEFKAGMRIKGVFYRDYGQYAFQPENNGCLDDISLKFYFYVDVSGDSKKKSSYFTDHSIALSFEKLPQYDGKFEALIELVSVPDFLGYSSSVYFLSQPDINLYCKILSLKPLVAVPENKEENQKNDTENETEVQGDS